MNFNDLQRKLKNENINPRHYSFDGKTANGYLVNDMICIVKKNEKWEVYYSERGSKDCLKIFDNEVEACGYFYEFLMDNLSH